MRRRGFTEGFTIIETISFLAITGLLIATLLTGVGVSLNNQRYADSVQSFKSFLQSQYGDLANVYNDRDSSWECDSTAKTSQKDSGVGEVRGQSNCFLMGRYITINKGVVTVTDLLGYDNSGNASGDDIDLLANYNVNVSKVGTETFSLEWGTSIAWTREGQDSGPANSDRELAILLVRSPDSGTIYTFTSDVAKPAELISQSNLRKLFVKDDEGTTNNPEKGLRQRVVCIDSEGLSTIGTMAVVIRAKATNASAIETRSNQVMTDLGENTQC